MTWAAGLARLGYEVWFVEQIQRARLEESPEAASFFLAVTRRHGLAGRSVLLDERGVPVAGADRRSLDEASAAAELLVNLGGHLKSPELLRRFRRKAYVDLDPGYTQFWLEAGLIGRGVEDHDTFFTVGLNLGLSHCSVPTCGIAWQPLPPPVLLSDWQAPSNGMRTFTSVASWRGTFGRVERDGHAFGARVHEFRKFIELPERCPAAFELALAIDPADGRDLAALRKHGWRLVDPQAVAPDPQRYRRYIQTSGAEFSIAQGIYVETASGWLSDRTARYLAAGKPAVIQDTGLGRHLPLGRGLLIFDDLEGAARAVRDVLDDYPGHSASARRIAAEHFDSDRVLGGFLAGAIDSGGGR
jgi:hypothetical protein